MSLKNLNADERAPYLLGLAVRRQFEKGIPAPDTQRAFDAIFRWAGYWLTPDEQADITQATGVLLDKDMIAEFQRLHAEIEEMKNAPQGDDDVGAQLGSTRVVRAM